MPTGYTAAIVDGKMIEFEQFAKECMRAFGATIHIRDESMGIEYIKREPSKYHSDRIKESEDNIKKYESMSDSDLLNDYRNDLILTRERYIDYIEKANKIRARLENIKSKVIKWQPPTEEHKGLKDFMINQLDITIEGDGNTNYYERELKTVNDLLNSIISPNKIREDKLIKLKKELEYSTKERREDIERCEKSNKWVEDLFKSLDKTPTP